MTPTVAVLHNVSGGGAHRRLAEQVAHVGLEVLEFTTSLATPVTDRPVVVPLRQLADAAPGVVRPPLRILDLQALSRAWRVMGRLAEDYGADLIFANPDQFLKGAMPTGSTRLPVLAYIDEPRRIDHEPELHHTLNPRTRRLYAPLRRREKALDTLAAGSATGLLTNSRYSRHRILAAYGTDASIVPCGVSDFFLDPARHVEQQPAYVLSVGSPIPTKGHELVIRAAATAAPDLRVVIAVSRENAEVARLRQVAHSVGVDLDVQVGVTDAHLRDLYRGALATMYLAQNEPFGLVSLEAQAAGCPVVVSDEGGLPETLEEGVSGFAVARTPVAAAAALTAIADGRRGAMGAAARNHAAEWTWRVGGQKLREAILATVADHALTVTLEPGRDVRSRA